MTQSVVIIQRVESKGDWWIMSRKISDNRCRGLMTYPPPRPVPEPFSPRPPSGRQEQHSNWPPVTEMMNKKISNYISNLFSLGSLVFSFNILGTTLTNQNSIQKEIKSRLKLGNACYHSVQNLLSSSLLSKNLKIKIYIEL